MVNFTPDTYNGLLNIYNVLQPNVDKSTALAQFQEKMTILEQSIFKKTLSCMVPIPQIQNRPPEDQWQKFDVVISGDYLYFYKDKFNLLPQYFMEVASIAPLYSAAEYKVPPRPSFLQPSGAENGLFYQQRTDPKTASAKNVFGGKRHVSVNS